MAVTDTPPDRLDNTRLPCIAICNWAEGPMVWDLVEDLSGVPWNPAHARTQLVEGKSDIQALASELVGKLLSNEVRALLLLGRTRHEGSARLQIRAEVPKIEGLRSNHLSPGVVRATAPTADILSAVKAAKVPVTASSDAEDDAGSRLLYAVMTALENNPETPAVGLMRFPSTMGEQAVSQAVKAAATVMTQHMAPQTRFTSAARF